MTASTKAPVIIDNGTGVTKAGFAGDEAPRSVFPALIGRAKHMKVMLTSKSKGEYIGDEALAKRGVLKLSYPIEHGVVTDWADMEKIWEYCLRDELRISPEEHCILMTEAPRNAKQNREKMCEIMFEHFHAKGFYVQIQAALALYSTGRTTGIVFDAGDGVSHTVPIFNGFTIQHAIGRLDLAGRDLTEWCASCLADEGIAMQTSAELDIIRQIKEKLCFVAIDYEKAISETENNNDIATSYTLPDGNTVQIGLARFKTPELLFQPELQGREMLGVHKLMFESIRKCDIDVRSDMYSNVVLSGGSTMFQGFPERLEKELQALVPSTRKLKVAADKNRKYSVFSGASYLCSLKTFEDMWISRAEYEEVGASIVHRKCQ